MWLNYGVDNSGILVYIEDVCSGKSRLKCPYCSGTLTAKKGKKKSHHFAHTDETCRSVANQEFPVLPFYDSFNIQLSGKDLKLLKLLWNEYGSRNYAVSSQLLTPGLLKSGLLNKNVYIVPPGYEFNDLGKIPVGALDLALFNSVQEPLILKKLLKLELAVEHATFKKTSDLSTRIIDLQLYRAQLRRILSCTLYFLEIQTDKELFYKVGVTGRHIQKRLKEVEIDLVAHYKTIKIEVLGAWENRGNIEKYFKHRYQSFNYPIGSLTEYYKFSSDNVKTVMDDLQQIQPKQLTQTELDILAEEQYQIKVLINR
ncbi:hypothetical protein NIES4071_83120 [Calothrix sp. NIES-4071]|nr:hypothetical protein NIES4071_83120 [Calothrix sp. NIES-4071]BAZ62580.1 hypothetical protein NIES4105_83050 [Calothrix sp. NIES-4105]